MDQQIVRRMKEVEKAILQLDESVRNGAFAVMTDYILGQGIGSGASSGRQTGSKRAATTPTETTQKSSKVVAPMGFQPFVDHFESDKPYMNARAIAAHLYREYGIESFSLPEIRELAEAGGVTIPERVDMTFLEAKHESKKLFKRAGRSRFRPTVHAEAYFKETFGVKKGNKKKPEPES